MLFPLSRQLRLLIMSLQQVPAAAFQVSCGICSLHWPPDKWGVCFSLAERWISEGQRRWLGWPERALLVCLIAQVSERTLVLHQSINHKSCMLWRTASHFPKLPECNLNISICMCLDFRSVADDMSKGCYATLWSHRSGTGAELPVWLCIRQQNNQAIYNGHI